MCQNIYTITKKHNTLFVNGFTLCCLFSLYFSWLKSGSTGFDFHLTDNLTSVKPTRLWASVASNDAWGYFIKVIIVVMKQCLLLLFLLLFRNILFILIVPSLGVCGCFSGFLYSSYFIAFITLGFLSRFTSRLSVGTFLWWLSLISRYNVIALN